MCGPANQRSHVNAGRGVASGRIEKVPAVGQEEGVRVPPLAAFGIEGGRQRWRSPGRRHTRESAANVGREQDHIAPAPGSRRGRVRIAERDGRATGRVDLPELAGGGERDIATIRRPERPRCALRAREGLGREGRERTHPQHRAAVRVGRDEGQVPAVRREGQEVGSARPMSALAGGTNVLR